jgi:hypothetical protein
VTFNRSSQRFAGFSSWCYISMSTIVIGSFIIFSSNVCLAKSFVSSVLPPCSMALGTITSRSGQQLLITPKQGASIRAEYSNAIHILKGEVAGSSVLRRGRDVKVLALATNNQARVVVLNPSNDTRQSSPLGCQIPQTTQNPAATPSGMRSSSEPIPNQGIIERVTDNTFTISLRTGQLKTFTWSTKTPFIQYTDSQSPKMLSSGAPVLLMGPMTKGVIKASRIAVLPQGQVKASFKRETDNCTDLGLIFSTCSPSDDCTGFSYTCSPSDDCTGFSYTCSPSDDCTGFSYTCSPSDDCTDFSYTCSALDDCTDVGLIFSTCSGDDQDTMDK